MDDDFSLLEVFFAMVYFFLFIAWIYLLVALATDIFRSRDLRGWAKALWVLFLVIVPVLGALVYLIARGEGMMERRGEELAQQEQAVRAYIQDAAKGPSTAEELEKLARLRDGGTITDAEFEAQKAKLLA